MLRRFRKKNMLLEDLPSTPTPDTLYPNVLSAEYFQDVQGNTFFNHLGYEEKPRESYGVMTLSLQMDMNEIDGPIQGSDFVDTGNGLVLSGQRIIQVNFDNSLNVIAVGDQEGDPYTGSALSSESAGKIEGETSFTSDDSYTVQLTVDQFVGVDFNANQSGNIPSGREQVHPLIHPERQAVTYLAGDPNNPFPRLATNRHNREIRQGQPDRETRPTFISMSVFQKESGYFKIAVKRSHVFAEVQVANNSTELVSVHDWKRDADVTDEYVEYTPLVEPVRPFNDPPVTMSFNNVTYIPRNILRIAWYAKGV